MSDERGPRLRYDAWSATRDTLHAHTQVLGKLPSKLAPPEPQLQHAALRLTARGWETGRCRRPTVRACSLSHSICAATRPSSSTATGAGGAIPLDARPGGGRCHARSARCGRESSSAGRDQPQAAGDGVDDAARRGQRARDLRHGAGRGYFAAATRAALVLAALRAPYRGRSTPVNAWWGSFDLAVSLFSGAAGRAAVEGLHRAQLDGCPGDRGRLVAGDHALSASCVLRLRAPAPDGLRRGASSRRQRALGRDARRVHPRLGRCPRRRRTHTTPRSSSAARPSRTRAAPAAGPRLAASMEGDPPPIT